MHKPSKARETTMITPQRLDKIEARIEHLWKVLIEYVGHMTELAEAIDRINVRLQVIEEQAIEAHNDTMNMLAGAANIYRKPLSVDILESESSEEDNG